MRGGSGQPPVVVEEPFTNTCLQNLLLQASNLGYNFDRNVVLGTPADGGAPASQTDADTNGEAGTATGAIESDDDPMDNAAAESAVAISLKRGDNQFLLDVVLLTLGPSPTVFEVLRHMRRCADPNTRAMRHELKQIPLGELTVGTARKPVSFRILDQYAGEATVAYRSLGTLDEAADRVLEPCIDCTETEDLRKFRTPAIPPSAPVFILYCQRQVSSRILNKLTKY